MRKGHEFCRRFSYHTVIRKDKLLKRMISYIVVTFVIKTKYVYEILGYTFATETHKFLWRSFDEHLVNYH